MSDIVREIFIAAIDIGTTYSGYAFCKKQECSQDKIHIYANSNWSSGKGFSPKTPTVILFDDKKNFLSFGYEAEDKYADICDEDRHHQFRLFRRFKMSLYETEYEAGIQHLSLQQKRKMRKLRKSEMTINDDNGQPMLARDVFAAAIGYMKDHLIKTVQKNYKSITVEHFHWVITVPAIWNDSAKQLMDIAAKQAGIPPNQLTLALEPEAAALFCKQENLVYTDRNGLIPFSPGFRFMIIDLGGGTVDISAHEYQADKTLKSLLAPSGGSWGGTVVDSKFRDFLWQLFGERVMQKFDAREYVNEKIEVERTFEIKKRDLHVDATTQDINIDLPHALYDLYGKLNSSTFEDALKNGRFCSRVQKIRQKLKIKNYIFTEMFKESTTSIISHVKVLLGRLTGINTILMVGGFSESVHVQTEVREALPGYNVIVPEEAGLAVVKGAVLYGYDINAISSRIMPSTYGVSTMVPFNPEIHLATHKCRIDNIDKCTDIFKVFVRKGETVYPNKTRVEHTFYHPYQDDETSAVEVYKTLSENPQYTTEEGSKKVAVIHVALTPTATHEKPLVHVEMLFGGPRISVKARQEGNPEYVQAYIDFLI